MRFMSATPDAFESKELSAPESIRKRIDRYAKHSPYMAAVYKMCDAHNLNDADRMTMVAMHSIAKAERLEERLLNMIRRFGPQ